MHEAIKLKKGLDVKLKGKPQKELTSVSMAQFYAIKPPDFANVVPKLISKPGNKVKAGTTLFYNKNQPEVKFTSPVSGTVSEVKRGERRRVLEVVIETNSQQEYETYETSDPTTLERDTVKELLLNSGLWPSIRQRPYNTIANPKDTPNAIFISGFNTRPLSPDLDYIVEGEDEAFQTGLNALAQLTDGPVHLSLNAEKEHSSVFTNAKGVNFHYFTGPHPAGEVGIQMHHISPVDKGDIYWHIHPQDIIALGRFFEKGIFDASRIIALTGPEVKNPKYFRTLIGAQISNIIQDNITQDNVRYVSGSVLSGTKIPADGYISYYDHHIAVLPEGNEPEMFGWLKPGLKKFSMSRTFLSSWLAPKDKKYAIDTNIKGGERPFVVTGEYEKVLPMDILPVQLLKAIIVQDIDKMEQLGIYEIAEEDLALCEFVCTSKQPVQKIVRDGINLMIQELG